MGALPTWELSENEFEQFSVLASNRGLKIVLEERETSENLVEGAISRITYNGFIRYQKGTFHFHLDKFFEVGSFRFAWLVLKDCGKKENKPFVQNLHLELSQAFPQKETGTKPPREVIRARERRNLIRIAITFAVFIGFFCALIYFALIGLSATFH